MREIKFRAWNIEKQIMVSPEDEATIIISTKGIYIDSEEYTVMQYTGLKDKNGKEIYGGDIVKLKDTDSEEFKIWAVEWLPTLATYNLQQLDIIVGEDLVLGDLEIIGNIYENKELLEEKQ